MTTAGKRKGLNPQLEAGGSAAAAAGNRGSAAPRSQETPSKVSADRQSLFLFLFFFFENLRTTLRCLICLEINEMAEKLLQMTNS